MAGWIAAALFIILIGFVLLSNVEMKIRIRRIGENDLWKFHIRWLYGLLKYTIKIPSMKLKGLQGLKIAEEQIDGRKSKVIGKQSPMIDREFIMKDYRKMMKLARKTRGLPKWFKQTVGHVRCLELSWRTELGVGEAVETATVTGLVWGVKGSLVGYVSNQVRLLVRPRLAIIPRYNEHAFATELNCIFKLRTGYAMVAGILLLVRVLRIKGGIKTWRNILFRAS